jgi:hypothetical protein
MTTTATRKPLTEIKQAAIYRCTDKQTTEVFYLIKSDTEEGVWYEIRFDHTHLAWSCTCPAIKPCKHERAVQQVLAIRRERIAAQMGGEMPAIVAEMQAEEDARQQTREEHLAEDRTYRHAKIERAMAERTSCKPRVLTEAEETAAAYYRMSLQEF